MDRRAFLLHAVAAAGIASLVACTTVDNVKDARGKGVKRTYKQPYDEVFGAAMHAANKKKLAIVSSVRDSGTILLSNGASLGSLGEHIAIFVSRVSERSTSVEVVARPVVGTVSFPPDWPSLLFGEIEEELTARRLKR
jgi:hypothetical protein